MRVVLFLLDAFRFDYISKKETPFLWDCCKKGNYIKHIIPSAGFCERAEIFTGLKPNESGFFTAIGYDPVNSPYKGKSLLKVFGKLELFFYNMLEIFSFRNKVQVQWIIRRLLIKVYGILDKEVYKLKFYSIPLSFLQYFNLTEDNVELEEIKLEQTKTIFNLIENNFGNYFMGSFTSLGKPSNGDDKNRIKIALEANQNGLYTFTPIYISAADTIGHKFGTNSIELKKTITEIDKILKEATHSFSTNDNDFVFVFLGDHGMTDVDSSIDIEKHLKIISGKNSLKVGVDFIYFLDSTIFRIWFMNSRSRNILESILLRDDLLLKNGTFLSESLANKYDIPFRDIRYGDMTWWANTGTLIFPDFFHRKIKYKAMHGYNPEDLSTHGTCIILGNGINKNELDQLHLSQIFHELKNLTINNL